MKFSSNQELIKYIKQKRIPVFLGGLSFVFAYLLFLLFYPKKYESSAVIYNSNKNRTESLKQDNTLQGLNESYTIINWVYSTQLINHVISKFNLYQHYEIDKSHPDAYSSCFEEASSAISINLTPYGAVKITVKDKNRFLAAALTNEIIYQIDKLNEQKVIENRKYVIREYEFLLKEFTVDVNSQHDSIGKFLSVLAQYSQNGNINKWKQEEVMNSLVNSAKNYERLSSEWLVLRKAHLLSLKELEKFNLPNFVILQLALPEKANSPYSFSNLVLDIVIFVFGMWIMIMLLVVYNKFSGHIKFVFGKTETIMPDKGPLIKYPINGSANVVSDDLNNAKTNN